MHVKYRNINEAFRSLVMLFDQRVAGDRIADIARSTSRNGDVLYIQEPVVITYTHPRERVLFNQARDCNPFFHLYEALWMLAGRNDVAPLTYYNSNIANYSDNGQTFNGAYGYRWRHHKHIPDQWQPTRETDQLKLIIDHLKAVPDSRRAVLQMWNVEDDLLMIGPQNQTLDCCCNTHVYFALRNSSDYQNAYYLDMTVCNRSNDLIWGLLGANAVHFSFLQEYMAACIGCEVGVYNQITNNCHVYLNEKWQPEKWLNDVERDRYGCNPWGAKAEQAPNPDQLFPLFPLVKDPATFDKEVVEFVEGNAQQERHYELHWTEPFLEHTAQPMCSAFYLHRQKLYDQAMDRMQLVKADDWRIAGTSWLLKRKAAYEQRVSHAASTSGLD